MFLIDTNCWMQLARERSEVDSVRELIAAVPLSRLHVSIYTVHSIGTILARRKMIDQYSAFLEASSIGDKIRIVDVPIDRLSRVALACSSLQLDFDDAYQYIAAELHTLRIVTLDSDFDRTPNGRLTPAAALKLFTDEQNKSTQKPPQDA